MVGVHRGRYLMPDVGAVAGPTSPATASRVTPGGGNLTRKRNGTGAVARGIAMLVSSSSNTMWNTRCDGREQRA